MIDAYITEEDEPNEDEKTNDNVINVMSDNSVDRLIDDLKILNEESEKLIYEIEHISEEQEKVDEINYEDMHYDREENYLQRTIRENFGTGVEKLQPSTEVNSYNSVIK